MRNDCKWCMLGGCKYGTYNERLSFVYEDLSPCKRNCKGYYNRDKYFEDLGNSEKYLKDNYGHLRLNI